MTQRSLPSNCTRCGSAALVTATVKRKQVVVCATCGDGAQNLPNTRRRRTASWKRRRKTIS